MSYQNFTKIFFLGFLSVLFVACGSKSDPAPAPIADFTFNPSTGRTPLEVTFTNTSKNAKTYSWDFGNGQSSTQENPKITFTTVGVFNVTLTATGDGGTTKISKSINIQQGYSKMSITKVTLLSYPPSTPNGSTWDTPSFGTFPDIFFQLTIENTATSLYTMSVNGRFDNVSNAMLPANWTATPPGAPIYTATNLTQGIDVDLYDYDSNMAINDFMGTCNFKPSTFTTGANAYPATITLVNGSLSFRLEVTWTN